MRFSVFAISAVLAFCACAAPARASGSPAGAVEAGLTWQLAFGGESLHAGYRMTMGYRGNEHFAPLSHLLDLNVSERAVAATLAGLPFFTHSYQADQDEAGLDVTTVGTPKPWYARSWVLWTAGGIAATAALAGSGSGTETHTCTGTCNSNQDAGSSGVTVVGGDGNGNICVLKAGTPADVCTPNPTSGAGFRADRTGTGWDGRPPESFESATGGMGDLAPGP